MSYESDPSNPTYERDRLLGVLDSISRRMVSAAVELFEPAGERMSLTMYSGIVEPPEDAFGVDPATEVELFFWTPLNCAWRTTELVLPPYPEARWYDFHPLASGFTSTHETGRDDYKMRQILEGANFDFGGAEALKESQALSALSRLATRLN